MLTGEDRYHQAMTKRRIVADRRIRHALRHDTGFIQMTDSRSFLIEALERAYAAGLRDAERIKNDGKGTEASWKN